MRAVRLEREKKERARANRLITGEPDPEEVSRPEHRWNVYGPLMTNFLLCLFFFKYIISYFTF